MASSVYYYNNNSHQFNETILVLFRACTPRNNTDNIIFGGRSIFNGLLALFLSSDVKVKSVYGNFFMLERRPPPCSSIKSVTVLFYKTNLTGPLSAKFISDIKNTDDFIFTDVPHKSHGDIPISQSYSHINNFISHQTGNVINDVIKPQSFSYQSNVMLQTTTIFSDTWMNQFDDMNTKPYPFHTNNGVISLQMMMTNKAVEIPKISLEYATVFKIPYDSGVSMIVYMPNNPAKYEQIHDDISALSVANRFHNIQLHLQNSSKCYDILRMPKFNYQTTTDITKGINGVAPFCYFNMSEMFQDKTRAPSKVSHEIYSRIDNNEQGTTTNTTYTAYGYDSSPVKTMGLTIDKPFGFFIVQDSGHIINLGIFTGKDFESFGG